MQLKMRDSEIARLKKGGEQSSAAADELLRVELDALKEHMCLEIQQLRARAEESERRLSVATSGENGGGLWGVEKETKFHHDLIARLEETESKYNEMVDRLEIMGTQRFEEAFGFTLSEARRLRTISEEALAKAQEGDVMLAVLRADNSALLLKQKEHETQTLDEVEIEKEKSLQLQQVVAALERELREKDEVRAGSRQIDEDEQRAREFEYRRQANKAMKDNAVLMVIKKKVEKDLIERTQELEDATINFENMMATVQSELTLSRAEKVAAALELSELMAQMQSRNELVRSLEMRCSAAELTMLASNKEIARLSFEVENANETNDNLYVQTEQLLQERFSFVETLSSAELRVAGFEALQLELQSAYDFQALQSLREKEIDAKLTSELLTNKKLAETMSLLLQEKAELAGTVSGLLEEKA